MPAEGEAAVRGHGSRPPPCDHEGTCVGIGINSLWCGRCGALSTDGQWRIPPLLAEAVRDRDTMCETLTYAQDSGSKLVEENRLLKARIARYGG